MQVLKNRTDFPPQELVRFAQREKNTKRGYLLVNPMQAKHIPCDPSRALGLFSAMGAQAAARFHHEKVVVIGFAETATAIGAAVAGAFDRRTLLLQTTREPVQKAENLAQFEEEHSHATSQALFCSAGAQALCAADRILFVEDEITTGKTILNFVTALKKQCSLPSAVKFGAVSLLNSMEPQDEKRFEKAGVEWDCLLKLRGEFDQLSFPNIPAAPSALPKSMPLPLRQIPGKTDPRTGVLAQRFFESCRVLSEAVMAQIGDYAPGTVFPPRGRVLVLGTEECMYPAIFFASELEKRFPDCTVRVHATTRSPILPYEEADYPLQNRICLTSLYDDQRMTYLYNLAPYDLAVIISDTPDAKAKGWELLAGALYGAGTRNIVGFQWGE